MSCSGCFNIIIIDNDIIIVNVISDFIKYGFEEEDEAVRIEKVTGMNPVYHAYTKIKKIKYDLIITDCEMPEEDGIELIKKIRKQGENKETPILAMSGYAGNAKIMLGAGANYFISKPIDFSIFMEKIKKLL